MDFLWFDIFSVGIMKKLEIVKNLCEISHHTVGTSPVFDAD